MSENNQCCGLIMAACGWLLTMSLVVMSFSGSSAWLVVALGSGSILLLGVILALIAGITGGGGKDRRYEEMMEKYEEQDWMRDR